MLCVLCGGAAAQESEIEIGEGEYAIESSAPKCDATDDVKRGEIIGSERFIFHRQGRLCVVKVIASLDRELCCMVEASCCFLIQCSPVSEFKCNRVPFSE